MVETISLSSNQTLYIDRDRTSEDFLLECRRLYLDVKDDVSVCKTELGAPYYSDHSCYVSLSHSHGLYVALLSSNAVGVDVELVRAIDYNALSKRFFNMTFDREEDFFRYWTSREALAKLYGQGLLPLRDYDGNVQHVVIDGYIVAIATKSEQ